MYSRRFGEEAMNSVIETSKMVVFFLTVVLFFVRPTAQHAIECRSKTPTGQCLDAPDAKNWTNNGLNLKSELKEIK